MDAVALVNKPCIVCGKTTAMWCGRCQNAWYCSPYHLQFDWPRHRGECFAVPTPTHTTLPVETSQIITASALLFAPGDDGPRIVGVGCIVIDGSTCPAPIVQSYFTENRPYAVILTQGLNGEPLQHPLHIFYCPLSLSRGSPVNNAIKRITEGAQTREPWCGTVLAMRFGGPRRQGYSDAAASDLAVLSAYFLAYKQLRPSENQ